MFKLDKISIFLISFNFVMLTSALIFHRDTWFFYLSIIMLILVVNIVYNYINIKRKN